MKGDRLQLQRPFTFVVIVLELIRNGINIIYIMSHLPNLDGLVFGKK